MALFKSIYKGILKPKEWGNRMWGICLDVDVLNGARAQSVVEYIIEDNKTKLISPVDNVVLDMSKTKEIPEVPQFVYGELVSPVNHLDMKGKIHTIKWHFNLKACYYYIQVDGKNKSKRYFEEDLVGVT